MTEARAAHYLSRDQQKFSYISWLIDFAHSIPQSSSCRNDEEGEVVDNTHTAFLSTFRKIRILHASKHFQLCDVKWTFNQGELNFTQLRLSLSPSHKNNLNSSTLFIWAQQHLIRNREMLNKLNSLLCSLIRLITFLVDGGRKRWENKSQGLLISIKII